MRATPSWTAGRRPLGALVAATLVSATVLVVTPSSAFAATTLTVNTTVDSAAAAGACGNLGITVAPPVLSLREATCLANNIGGAVTITVPAGTYHLTNGELAPGIAANQVVTINGAGPGASIIDAGNLNRVLDLDSNVVGGVTVNLTGLTITGGRDGEFGGAGIIGGSGNRPAADVLTIDNSVISNNADDVTIPTATNEPGGGVQFLGGRLSITNSTISNNSSQSSSGAGIAYGANGAASPEGLTITNSTISNNSMTETNSNTALSNGGALSLRGTASTNYTLSGDRFIGNTVTASTGSAVGAAIWSQAGILDVTGSTFTGNSVSGGAGTPSGGAIAVTGGSASLHYNRFAGDSATAGSALAVLNGAAVDAASNWWGCNTGPNTAGCESTSGNPTVSPRLVLSASASPAAVVGPNATSTVTAGFTTDNLGAAVGGANLGAFAGLSVQWSLSGAGDATLAAPATALSGGQASVQVDSHSVVGPFQVQASFDNATVATTITAQRAPAITSGDNATFQIGTFGTFTVTSTGYPTPAISTTSTLPAGVSLTDNGNGTATLSGTPAAGTGGSYPLTLTASNGVNPVASQSFTLTVGSAPSFISSNVSSFTAGNFGSFAVTTSGSPTVTTITETGTLPSGLSLQNNGNGTATLSGTPAAGSGGSYSVVLHASNGVSPDASQTLSIHVADVPDAPTGVSGTASGGTATVNWSAPGYTGGSALTSYTVTGTDGTDSAATPLTSTVTGTPPATTTTISGLVPGHSYTFTVTATNADGLTSAPSAPSAPVSSGTAPTVSGTPGQAVAGSAYSFAFTVTGSPAPTVSVTAGSLPPGLSLSSSGVLSGTPSTAGSYDFTVGATNGIAPDAADPVTLVVVAAVPDAPSGVSASAGNASATVTWTAPVFTGGSPLSSYSVTATDNSQPQPPVTVPVTGSPLPTSATVSGLIPGDVYTFTVTATNSAGTSQPSQASAPVTPYSPPSISGTAPAGAAGAAYSFSFTTGGFPAPTVSVTAGSLPPGLVLSSGGTLSGTPSAVGSYQFGVTADNGHAPAATESVTLTVHPGAAATVTATSGMNQAATAGQPFYQKLTATVTDSVGNPIAGAPVTFTVTSGSAGFPGGAQAATVIANGSGVAVSPVLTAGKTAGPVTVTATSGAATSAIFNETVIGIGSARADLAVTLSSPAAVGRGSTFTVTVKVTNKGPNSASTLLTSLGLGNGLSVVSAPGGHVIGGAVLFSASGLATNASLTYSVTLRAGSHPLTSGLVADSLSVVRDPNLLNNLALAKLKVS